MLFSSREGHFSLRWIRGIRAIRRRAYLTTSERCTRKPSWRYHSKWRAGLAATVSDDEPIGIGQIQHPPLCTLHEGHSGGRGEEVTSSLRSGKSPRGLSCVASQGRSAGGHSPRRSSAYQGGYSRSAGAVHRAPYSRVRHRGGGSQGS